jgi:hypothetical protein
LERGDDRHTRLAAFFIALFDIGASVVAASVELPAAGALRAVSSSMLIWIL